MTGTSPNQCANGVCNGVCNGVGGNEGESAAGPDDRTCDGIVRANGEGVLACNGNADCAVGTIAVAAGHCTLVRRRRHTRPSAGASSSAATSLT